MFSIEILEIFKLMAIKKKNQNNAAHDSNTQILNKKIQHTERQRDRGREDIAERQAEKRGSDGKRPRGTLKLLRRKRTAKTNII